jgi:hypothetical protein
MIANCRHGCSCLRLLLILPLSGLLGLGCKKSAEVSGQSPAQRNERDALWFEEATAGAGLDFIHQVETSGNYLFSESLGSGAAFLDFDNDGRLDIYLIHNVNPAAHATNRLFRNSGNQESARNGAPLGAPEDGSERSLPHRATSSLPAFVDVSAGSGLDVTGYGNGLAVGDVNNDGLPEVLITEYDRIRLFLNNGGGKFTDVTAAAGLTNQNWSVPAAFVDYDRDGWLDLVIGNYLDFDPTQKCFDAKGQPDFCGPHGFHSTVTRLFRNVSMQKSEVSAQKSEVRMPRFEDVTVSSGLSRAPGKAMEIVCADFDGDHWPDIFITDDGLPNRLFMNQRNGTFKEEAVQRGVAYTATGATAANMGVALGDVDNDGLFDLFVPHLTEENHTLWRQSPRGLFQDETARAGLLKPGWHGTGFAAVFADFDCDGALDLAIANGQVRRRMNSPRAKLASGMAPFWKPYAEPAQLFANDGQGSFREISAANPAFCGEALVGRGLVCGDIDNDGALDLLLTGIGGPARLYRNTFANAAVVTGNATSPHRHWLGVRALIPAFGNRDAYGAEVMVQGGGRRWWRLIQPAYGYASSHDPRVHFGLGSTTTVESIHVRWPDGVEEIFSGGDVDRYLTLRQGSGALVKH